MKRPNPRQQRLTTPAMRRADLARVGSLVESCNVRNITRRHLELFYDLAGGDVVLAVNAICDIAAGRVSEELRHLLAEESK